MRVRTRARASIHHDHNIIHNAAFQIVELLVAMPCGCGHLHNHIVILGGVWTVRGEHQRIIDAPRGWMQIMWIVGIDFGAYAIIVIIIIRILVVLIIVSSIVFLFLASSLVVGLIMVLILNVVRQQLGAIGGVANASVSMFLLLPARWLRLRLRLRFRLWFQLWQTVGEKYYSICKEPKGGVGWGAVGRAGMREVQKQFSARKVQIRESERECVRECACVCGV